jgi:hypothetical protein
VVVDGRIYRSGRLGPEALRRVIVDHGVRTIVDFGVWKNHPSDGAERDAVTRELGVSVFQLWLSGDGRGNPNAYVEALRVMADPARQPVLVQCAAGAMRTGAAVLLYRHVIEGVPIQEAYAETFAYGLHPSSWKMLAYLADWGDAIARAYRTGVPIPGVPPVAARAGEPVDARGPVLPPPPASAEGARSEPQASEVP